MKLNYVVQLKKMKKKIKKEYKLRKKKKKKIKKKNKLRKKKKYDNSITKKNLLL